MKQKRSLKIYLKWLMVVFIATTLVAAVLAEKWQRPAVEAYPLRNYPVKSDSHNRYINYIEAFCDSQEVQLPAAQACGIQPLRRRLEVESQPQLVEIHSCREYLLDTLDYSVPYLTRDAAEFLRQLGDLFEQYAATTSHRMIVTSVLRTEEDVIRLQHSNRNATTQSCHLYGTTFDIAYRRFEACSSDSQMSRLQHALFAAAYDMRASGYCFVKYEKHQACLHITLRPEQ